MRLNVVFIECYLILILILILCLCGSLLRLLFFSFILVLFVGFVEFFLDF